MTSAYNKSYIIANIKYKHYAIKQWSASVHYVVEMGKFYYCILEYRSLYTTVDWIVWVENYFILTLYGLLIYVRLPCLYNTTKNFPMLYAGYTLQIQNFVDQNFYLQNSTLSIKMYCAHSYCNMQ